MGGREGGERRREGGRGEKKGGREGREEGREGGERRREGGREGVREKERIKYRTDPPKLITINNY